MTVTLRERQRRQREEYEMTDSPVAQRAATLIAPILADLHLDTWDCEFAGGVLRFTFDKPVGEGNVTLDELSLATRLINRELDHAEPPFPNISIEVTSPGLERTLRTPDHFKRSIGKDVAIRLLATAEGDRRVHGTLVEADNESVIVQHLAERRTVRYGLIERAKTVFVWGPTPKPGKASTAKDKASKTKASKNTAKPSENQSSDHEDSEIKNDKELAS
jgi:ribosome maturation factor RimP